MPRDDQHAHYIITLPDGTERDAWDHVKARKEEVCGWVSTLTGVPVEDMKIRRVNP